MDDYKVQLNASGPGYMINMRFNTAEEVGQATGLKVFSYESLVEYAQKVARKFNGIETVVVKEKQETLPDYACPQCGSAMHFQEGEKNGKKWFAYFCNSKGCKGVRWSNKDKTVK